MASVFRSARLLARAASGLSAAASTSGAAALASGTRAAAMAARAEAPLVAVPFSVRAVHGSPLCWSGVSPLQRLPGTSPLQAPPSPSASGPSPSSGKGKGLAGRYEGVGEYGEPLYTVHRVKDLHVSFHKLNDAAKFVRGMSTTDALLQLQVSVKKTAAMVRAALVEAIKKAEDAGADAEALLVHECWVGKGSYIKRVWPAARGRANVRLRYRAHLTVVLKSEKAPVRTVVVPTLLERAQAKRNAYRN